jgi:hypothetical protein
MKRIFLVLLLALLSCTDRAAEERALNKRWSLLFVPEDVYSPSIKGKNPELILWNGWGYVRIENLTPKQYKAIERLQDRKEQ